MATFEVTAEIFEDVAHQVSSGQTLNDILRAMTYEEDADAERVKAMLKAQQMAWHRFIKRTEGCAEKWKTALEARCHALLEECLDIADQSTTDNWQKEKFRVWTRQQVMAKTDPDRWGDRQNVKVDGHQPLVVSERALKAVTGDDA